jgi:hypothetical protein
LIKKHLTMLSPHTYLNSLVAHYLALNSLKIKLY